MVKLDARTGASEIVYDGVAAQVWDLAIKPGRAADAGTQRTT